MAADESTGDWLVQGTTDADEVAKRYDDWAERYDADLASWSYRAPEVVVDQILRECPAAEAILDVGCGTGLVGNVLRSKGFGGQLTGLDISRSSLRLAEQRGAYDGLRTADLQRPLDVADDSMDALTCVGVLTYLPDVEAVWREFARVVRPGGVVAMTQREDLWEPRHCRQVIDRAQSDGVWTPLEIRGPAPYLPEADGGLGDLGCYYVLLRVS